MKYYFLIIFFLLGFNFNTIKAEDFSNKIESLKTEVDNLKEQNKFLNKRLKVMSSKNAKIKKQILEIQIKNKKIVSNINILQDEHKTFVANQKSDKSELVNSIGSTNKLLKATKNVISIRTLWGTCGLVIIFTALIIIVFVFLNKIKSEKMAISDVHKAQEDLQATLTKMQEESIRLDNKLLDIVQKQIEVETLSIGKTTCEPDHSLVVKLADEVARIETNLSKMDKSVRGYKQLVQAKDRMINNVRANGYEIISLLGQEYNDGMQFQTRFVPDDSLPEGKRIITGMIKMQVNYNGKMIQPAEIVVSQNI